VWCCVVLCFGGSRLYSTRIGCVVLLLFSCAMCWVWNWESGVVIVFGYGVVLLFIYCCNVSCIVVMSW